jgi:hypothetical protein
MLRPLLKVLPTDTGHKTMVILHALSHEAEQSMIAAGCRAINGQHGPHF